MNLKNIEKPENLLDTAFRKARKKSKQYKQQSTPFYTKKGKEIAKIDAIYDYLQAQLFERVKEFPSIDKLDPFYKDLFRFVINTDETKKALSSITSVVKKIKKLRTEKIVFLKEMKFERGSIEKIQKLSNEYFGRTSSLIKSLEKPIAIYNDSIKKLRELPTIKTDEEVFLLAGLPNAGKSTLLGKVTESKPRVAEFPFTTKGLNVGKFTKKYVSVQVIDTPGLLDRELSKRNDIEMKAISAFQHLKGIIIFVVDPLEEAQKQKNLLFELKKLFNDKGFIVVINKQDLVDEKRINELKKEFEGNEIIDEGKNKDNLKKYLLS
jgi:nucleolar GTP-binding protein